MAMLFLHTFGAGYARAGVVRVSRDITANVGTGFGTESKQCASELAEARAASKASLNVQW